MIKVFQKKNIVNKVIGSQRLVKYRRNMAKVSDLQTPEPKHKAKKNISACRNEICNRRRFGEKPFIIIFTR